MALKSAHEYCSKTGTFCMSGWGYIGQTCLTNVEGVEHGPNGHADDGQPHLSNILRWPSCQCTVWDRALKSAHEYCSKTGTLHAVFGGI